MRIKLMKKQFLSLMIAGLSLQPVLAQTISWPAPTLTSRPWTRWWWEGSAVNKADLTWNLEQYQQAGLGGVEITPIYGVQGAEAQFVPFLSTQWMQLLQHTLNESSRLKLGVDLANATGWPFGGPWVGEADASKSVYAKSWKLAGGARLTEPVRYKREAWLRLANNKQVSIDTLRQPVTANKNLQALAIDQIQYPGYLPLQALVAYHEDGSYVDLTAKVDKEGNLNWTAGPGNWTIWGLFQGLHGKMVERAAPGGEGYAIDHFSAKAASNYFKPFDQAFKGYNLSYLRGFFNDSYEVDDARGQGNWTPEMLKEFQQRKGYDLRRYLPALFGKSTPEENSRVLYDYRSVIDELILYNFTHQWKNWSKAKGKLVRNQSHGSPANTLDLYSVVDIPETEGTDVLRFKFASSAANVSGKKLTAAESATWLNEHFLSSLGDVKKAIDLYFLGGVNHIVYHGTAYSPKAAAWPGWLFYAAVHFQPTNPQWKDFHQLNTYITRVQGFLQQGKPANDVLLYYPIADRYMQPGNVLLQHFDGMERNFEKTNFEHVAKTLLEKGYGFDFFSDRQLKQFSFLNNKIMTGGNAYKTMLLPGNQYMDPASFAKLLSLVKAGASLLVYKALPADVPGMAGLAGKQKQLQALLASVQLTTENGYSTARLGKGRIFLGNDPEVLLTAAAVQPVLPGEKELAVLRRRYKDNPLYFLNNRTQTSLDKWITLPGKGIPVLYDAMTGNIGLAATRKNAAGATECRVQLDSFASVILIQYAKLPAATAPFVYRETVADPVPLQQYWAIEFMDGGPVLPEPLKVHTLQSWNNYPDENLQYFSGTAIYTTRFSKPAGEYSALELNLGKVGATASVKVNGTVLGSLIGPVFSIRIPASLLKENNELEVQVSSLMANRIAWMDRNNKPWKIFYNINMQGRRRENTENGVFNARLWMPLPSGLLGPVTLTPLK